MLFDHVLLIGFGGPERPEEVMPFIRKLTEGFRIPEERLQTVADHYALTGGASPYNRCAFELLDRLQESVRTSGLKLPLFLGMRNWHPFLKEVLPKIKGQGLSRGLALVLAPHRSLVSFDRYCEALQEAQAQLQISDLSYEFLPPWFDHPDFIQAQAQETGKILGAVTPQDREGVALVFTAHSIPQAMATGCRYVEEIKTSCAGVARALGVDEWSLAYQSRSGSPKEPWLEPDTQTVLQRLRRSGKHLALFVPIGFLFDHTEVLYDLDIQARQEAQEAGMAYRRASTVMQHPGLVRLFTQQIQQFSQQKELRTQ